MGEETEEKFMKIQGKKVLIVVDSGFQNSPSNLFAPNFQTSPDQKKKKSAEKMGKWPPAIPQGCATAYAVCPWLPATRRKRK